MKLTPQLLQDLRKRLDVSEAQWQLLLSAATDDAFEFAKEVFLHGWSDRDTLGMALADSIPKAYLNLEKTLFQQDVVDLLPASAAKKFEAIPVYQFGSAVTVAMTDPADTTKVAKLQSIIGKPIDCLFSFRDEIDAAISIYYQSKNKLDDYSSNIDIAALERLNETKRLESHEVIQLSDSLILFALKERASDIHLQPNKNAMMVRLRIDGVLIDYIKLDKSIANILVSRFKILSQMDISEKRKPQDGRMVFETAVKNIDIRVSSLPTMHGEKLVLRLLGSIQNNLPLNIDKLDISADILNVFKLTLRRPNGLILVTGPTGSGKTTTLYAALNFLNDPDLNIITIEDPVEYEISNFTQVAVNDKVGRTFSSVLRASLRQDPDVILVGETRDAETANIASQAALTGHLVLTTLHTNSALQAITRLLDMGVQPYILSPSLNGILAQRLVRRLCEHCKTSYIPEESYLRQYFHWQKLTILPSLYRATGCEKCGGSGFKGRIGIHEFLKIDPKLKSLIAQNAPFDKMLEHVRSTGFNDIRFDGFRKALQGRTTLEEVIQITSVDD